MKKNRIVKILLLHKTKNLNNDMFNILDKFLPKKINKKELDYFAIGSGKSFYNPPKNNDGRDFCWWCGGKIKMIQGFNSQYCVCKDCGK